MRLAVVLRTYLFMLRGSWDCASQVKSTLIEVFNGYKYSYLTYKLTY